jgi:hypothetical protein
MAASEPTSMPEVPPCAEGQLSDDWTQAQAAMESAVAGLALAAQAALAFHLAAITICRDPLIGKGCRPTEDFVRDCAAVCSGMSRTKPGLSRVIYFPTRPGQLPDFFGRLVFYVLFARACGHRTAVAWLAFPVALLGSRLRDDVTSVVSSIDATAREMKGAPAGDAPVTISFEPDAGFGSIVHVGGQRPVAWDDIERIDLGRTHGLPMICIPSRSAATVTISEAPWHDPTDPR